MKRFGHKAPTQWPVLDAFEAAGWPRRIPCPMKGKGAKRRQRDTVESLNNRQEGLRRIRFHVDAEGGISWEVE